MRFAPLACLILLFPTAGCGVDLPAPPPRLEVQGRTLALNGVGQREDAFGRRVYNVGLYLERSSTDPEAILSGAQAKVLRMQFAREVSREAIARALVESFAADDEEQLDLLDKLCAWLPTTVPGDVLEFAYLPDVGTSFSVNGESRGTLIGSKFATNLWTIWLGETPPSTELKQRLLGLPGGDG